MAQGDSGQGEVFGPVQMAALLMEQLGWLGRLCLMDDLVSPSGASNAILKHVPAREVPTLIILTAVQEQGVVAVDPEMPYLFSPGTWPPGVALVGYIDGFDVPIDRVAWAMMSYWKEAARAAFPLSRELWRILRAALWSSLHFGFEGTLGQIVDLVENGWVLDADAALAIMKLLLLARSHVDSELEMVDRFIADGAPGDDEAWKTSQPGDWSWLAQGSNELSDEMRIAAVGILSLSFNP